MPIVTVTRRLRFNAAHRLHNPALSDEENTRLFGKCNNPNWHGHNYVLEVAVEGPIDERTGYVIDLTKLKSIVQHEVIDRVENPVDKAQLLTLMYLIYRIGPLAASMAVSTAFLTPHDLLRGVEAHTARGHGRQPCYRRLRSGETHKSFR